MKSKKYYWIVALLVAMALILAACGSEEEPTEEPVATEAPAEEPTEEPMEEPTEEPMEEPTEEPMEEPMEETKTIFVGPTLVECTGVAPQECLQIKESPDEEYQLWYSPIEGFDFEEGYEYELVVAVEENPDAPADASTLNYVLVEEVSKTPAEVAEEPMEEPAEEMAALSCEEPIKVGLITDETGPLGIYGAHVLRAFPLGMEYLTGEAGTEGDGYTSYMLDDCEIQVFIRDDQSNPETTAAVGRELIEVEGVDILVGTVSSGATATLQELARENDVIHIAAPAAANDLTGATFTENSFRTSRNNYQDAVNICQYLTQDYTKFVQIAPDYSFGYGGATAFRDACTLFGAEFVADDIFAPADTTDFTPYMDSVLDAIDNGAEALLVTWAGGGFIPLVQAANDLGVTDEIPFASAFVDNPTMPAFFADAIGTTSGILYHYTMPDNEINDWLVEQTSSRLDTWPDLFDADAMNAALLIGEALKAAGGDASAEALRGVMEGMEFEGPKGTIYIRPEDHVAMQDMYIATLLNVDDPDFNYYEYVETNRPDVPCLLPEGLQDRCGDLPIGSLSGQ
jgi:branched-chain amino acid transport system substrate-binding protein